LLLFKSKTKGDYFMGNNQNLRSKFARTTLLALAVGVTAGTQAQIMLKPIGDSMQPLRQKSIEADVKISGQFASTKITHVFENPLSERVEAEFVYVLPKGATVTSFAYWYGDEKVPAYVAEKERAREIYKSITTRQRDPALVELVGKNSFRAKIFPVMPNADLRVEITYVSVLTTEKGVPTFSLPIAMKKGEPLESLKAHVEIDKEDWIHSIFNSRGKVVSEEDRKAVIEVDEKNVRPAENFRLGFKPKSPAVSCFSGRAAGKDGYFILTVPSANQPKINVAGVKFFSLHTSRLGTKTVVTGKYRGSGMGTVTFGASKAPITLSDEAKGAHIAVKKWASDEIERLTADGASKEVISLSMLHGMPSKYTAWIAIPQEERALHQRLINEAQAKVYAKKYVDLVFKQGRESAQSRRYKSQFEVAARKMNMNYQDTIHELADQKINNVAETIRRKVSKGNISSSARQEIRRDMQHLKVVTKAFNMDFETLLGDYFEYEYIESATRIARFQTGLNQSSTKAQIAKDTQKVKTYSDLLGIPMKDMIVPEIAQCLRDISSDALSNFYQGKISRQKVMDQAKRVRDYQAKFGIKEIGFEATSTAYSPTIREHLAKEQLKEDVSKQDLAKAHEWLEIAEAFHGTDRKRFFSSIVSEYLINDSYQIQSQYLDEARKSSSTSPTAQKYLDRLSRNLKLVAPSGQNAIEPIVQQVATQTGSTLAFRAFDSKGSRDQVKKEAKEADLAFKSKFPTVKFDKETSVSGSYQSGLKENLENLANRLMDSKNQLRLNQNDIQNNDSEFKDYAQWTGYDPQEIVGDVFLRSGNEWKVRYRLYQLYLTKNADQAEVRRLEQSLMQLTGQFKGKDYVQDRMSRLKVNADINNLIDEIGEKGNSPEKAELERKRDELIAKEKIIAARMGDPILSVNLPSTSTNVWATFPWGEKRPMTWNAKTQQFECHFDIPPTAVEGIQAVEVTGKAKDGTAISLRDNIHVDVTAPQFKLNRSAPRFNIEDLSGDVARVKVFVDGQPAVTLTKGAESTWWTALPIRPNDDVRVVVTDKAHNRSEYPASPFVQPKVAPILHVNDARSELRGQNVQSMGQLGESVFAGTLDEGLWVRDDKGAWSELKGLPSRCPRTMVRFEDHLIVRFSDGSLIELSKDLSWKSIDSNLPRRQAMSITTSGSKLFVAQPGGFSVFDGKEWTHHFGIKLLTNAAVSALAASDQELWIGVQGLGIVVVDLTTNEARLVDERSGLTDDWVTQISLSSEGVSIGTFVGGALIESDQAFTALPETANGCVTSISENGGLIGTRTGLFSRKDGVVQRIVSKGLPEEIQCLMPVKDGVWVGTRTGVKWLKL
jgi:hypothetical protein